MKKRTKRHARYLDATASGRRLVPGTQSGNVAARAGRHGVLCDDRQRASAQAEEKEYVNERFQTANWLVKSLHQRATTILKVAGEILSQQDAFFRHGVEHLKPLILRDIAEAIEMHESTVSRVTTNKFMATPRGLYELKYFFTSAIQSVSGGDAHSAEAVRFRIKALIDNRSPKSILSDDKIVDILRERWYRYRPPDGRKIP